MNLVWLKTFCELAKQKHFTRTAELLNMTQSGVSQHIKKLEDSTGSELLLREGKSFTLTETGKRLFSEATDLLDRFENLQQVISHDPTDEGVVRIMSPGSIGSYLYPKLLERQAHHPKLAYDYRFAPNSDIEQAVIDDRIDIGLVTRVPAQQGITSVVVSRESLLLVTPNDPSDPHDEISWERLNRLGFINHPDGGHHAQLLLGENFDEFEHVNSLSQSGFINQISLILEPVSKGLGFTVLPQHAVEAYSKQELIKIQPLNHPVSETLYLCQRKGKVLPNRVGKTVDAINRYLS